MLQAGNLTDVPHGFSTRNGEDPCAVLPHALLVMAKQIHSAIALPVSEPWNGAPAEADALYTNRRDLLIGIVTADCAPVLLADTEAGVVAAAHAGWRGAVAGVIESAIAGMESIGARRDRIAAAIGPTIAQASYEVDTPFRQRFAPEMERFFASSSPGRWQFDLPGYVACLLRDAGVRDICDMAQDTYAHEARFFSFRRATHRGAPTGGRQTSVIGLPPT